MTIEQAIEFFKRLETDKDYSPAIDYGLHEPIRRLVSFKWRRINGILSFSDFLRALQNLDVE